MSLISNSFKNQLTAGDNARYDDIQPYANYATIAALPIKYEQVYYKANDTGNMYRWDGVSLILQFSGSGSVNSVSAGTNISVTGTATDPIINTVTTPSFVQAIATTAAPTLATHLTRKDYVDLKVASVSAASSKIAIAGTSIAPTIDVTEANLTLNNIGGTLDVSKGGTNLTIYTTGDIVYASATNTLNKLADVATGNALVSGGVGVAPSYAKLNLTNYFSDVNTTGVATNDALIYNGSQYVPRNTTSTIDLTNGLLFCAQLNALITGNTQTVDSSSYALVGTLNVLNGTNLVAGKLSNCIQFLGVNNQYIDFGLANHLNFQISTPFSLAFWYRTTQNTSTDRTLISRGLSTNGSGWYFNFQGSNQRFTFHFSDNLTTRALEVQWNFSAGTISDDAWHFITLVHRNTGGWNESSLDLYVDGVIRNDVKNPTIVTLLSTDDITAAAINFQLGGMFAGGNTLQNAYLDQVCIFNTSLVQSNVTSLYNSGTGTELFGVSNVLSHIHYPTDLIGQIPVPQGGTGLSSYTVGDLVYASGVTTLSHLADVATGNVLRSGGVGVAPAYGKVALTTDISGTLPIANGGTGITTTPSNGFIPIGNGTNYTAAALTAGSTKLSVTNGAGSIALDVVPANIDKNALGGSALGVTRGGLEISTIPSSGWIPIGNGVNYTSAALTAGSSKLSIANGVGSVTLDVVTANIDKNATGGGVLTVANGGTGISTTPSNGFIPIGNGTNYTAAALTASTNMTVTNASGSITLTSQPKNILLTSDKISFAVGTRFTYTIIYNSFGSAQMIFGGTDTSFDSMIIFKGAGYPKSLNNSMDSLKTFVVYRLSGVNWASGSLATIVYGFVNDGFINNVETNITVSSDVYNLPNTGTSRGVGAQFGGGADPTICAFWGIPSKGSTNGTRTGTNTTTVNTAVNDYIVFYAEPSTNLFTTIWFNSSFVAQSTATIAIPQGNTNINNFTSSQVYPFIDPSRKNAGWEIDVITQRELTSLGFTPVSGGVNYFAG